MLLIPVGNPARFGGLKQLYSQYLLRCIMCNLLRYYKDQTQPVGLFFKNGVLEFVVYILD